MINALIEGALRNRGLVILLTLMMILAGVYAMRTTPVDAIPDLSDVQVIIKTSYPGQAPQVVEDLVTYPLSTAMMAAPGAVDVRGYSFFGDSYVYVLFEDGTDLYWARSRVLEYLSQVAPHLPADANPALGPDATGVGWVFEYALVDRNGQHDLAALRSFQDWFLRFELQSLPGVAEVATIGGMVRQYQVVVDPQRLRLYNLTVQEVRQSIAKASAEAGGAVVELAEAEYMVRASGYVTELDDLASIPLRLSEQGTPIVLSDVATIQFGPQIRRGIAELNGEGEVVGGVIIMRQGENAMRTIERVKLRLEELTPSLPEGVEIVTAYDRSDLIHKAIQYLQSALLEELTVVSLILALFLWQWRAALVVIISLPVGVLVAFIIMRAQGINANIMSLGGIAIAIGAMVDAAIVLIENTQRHLEEHPDREHWLNVKNATTEVGGPLFFSLLIITLSFIPVFTLQAQEGRLFAPLAYTKTYAMAGAAMLAVTLVPVLLGWLLRPARGVVTQHPVNQALKWAYRPFLSAVLRHPWKVVLAGLFITVAGLWPLRWIGSEFIPPLDEGDLLYMPSTDPALSAGKARQLLQQTDRLLATVPEVATVFGKIGRAETATDPAPLTMVETTIRFKPRDQWRAGMTVEKLREELDQTVRIPGIRNVWVMPIRNRIDMLATGIKTPVGIKVGGPDLSTIEAIGQQLVKIIEEIPGVASVYADRAAGGRYISADIKRDAAARYGLGIQDVQDIIRTAVGGMNVAESIEGRERYPINLRYPQSYRDSVARLRELPFVTPHGAHIALGDVADIHIETGPPMIKSENGRLSGWVYIDLKTQDIGGFVNKAQRIVNQQLDLPSGYSLSWTGQFEYLQRAEQRLRLIVPMTLAVIVLLLYLAFHQWSSVFIVLSIVPASLVGGVLLIWRLDYQLSVAVVVGFIALAGVAVELGVVMLVYLRQALSAIKPEQENNRQELIHELMAAALLRIRPVLMTVVTTVGGLLPVMLGQGAGSEVMRRIAAPMVGGMLSATLMSLLVIPAIFVLWHGGWGKNMK